MNKPLGIVELLTRIGDDQISFQELIGSATNFQARKKPSPHTAVTFLTDQITPSEVMAGKPRRVCLVVWLPAELVEKARKEHAEEDI